MFHILQIFTALALWGNSFAMFVSPVSVCAIAENQPKQAKKNTSKSIAKPQLLQPHHGSCSHVLPPLPIIWLLQPHIGSFSNIFALAAKTIINHGL